jgi:CheY-like chemotaxis protein
MKKITRSILLVEDNPMDIDLTRRAFAKRKLLNPFEVLRDGEEALTYIRRWEVDAPLPVVILLDLKLPKVDGLEVLREMKAHPQFCTVPVVILTTSAEDSDIQTAYQLGANSYIIKPVDFEKFMEVAEQVELYWNVLNKPPN